MATKSVTDTPNLPAPQTHKGCCDKFLAGLQQIKQWACTFFQWLFCCKRSEKPILPTKVKTQMNEKGVLPSTEQVSPPMSQTQRSTQIAPARIEKQENEKGVLPPTEQVPPPMSQTQRNTQIAPVRIEKQERDQGGAIGEMYFSQLIKVFKETTPIAEKRQVLNRSGLALLRCMNPKDQVSLLRFLSTLNVIDDWTPFIRLLPSAAQGQLDLTNPDFNAVNPPQIESLAPEKLFLHSMLMRLFVPQPSSPRFEEDDIERFKRFAKEEQFFILYTLMAIGMDDQWLKTALNYTEIDKLLNHSKIKEPFYECLAPQSTSARSRCYVRVIDPTPFTEGGLQFMIHSASDLIIHFTALEAMAKKPGWNTLLNMPLSKKS